MALRYGSSLWLCGMALRYGSTLALPWLYAGSTMALRWLPWLYAGLYADSTRALRWLDPGPTLALRWLYAGCHGPTLPLRRLYENLPEPPGIYLFFVGDSGVFSYRMESLSTLYRSSLQRFLLECDL